MKKSSGVYQIKNKENGKRYIGSSVNVTRRFYEHKRTLRKGEHHNRHLQRAFDKYGLGKFVFEVLEYVLPEKTCLEAREQHFLDKYFPEYNMNSGATNSLGYKHSEETIEENRQSTLRFYENGGEPWNKGIVGVPREDRVVIDPRLLRHLYNVYKLSGRRIGEVLGIHFMSVHRNLREFGLTRTLSESAKCKPPMSNDAKEKISEAMSGRILSEEHKANLRKPKPPRSEEHRRKLSEVGKGKMLSEETRRKISTALKGRPKSAETRINMCMAQKKRFNKGV